MYGCVDGKVYSKIHVDTKIANSMYKYLLMAQSIDGLDLLMEKFRVGANLFLSIHQKKTNHWQ